VSSKKLEEVPFTMPGQLPATFTTHIQLNRPWFGEVFGKLDLLDEQLRRLMSAETG